MSFSRYGPGASLGHKAQPSEASLFTAFLRIPAGALAKLLASTPTGVYAEPRGQQPREPDDKYSVVWLPGASYDEALHQSRTFSKTVCLVRMRNKFGVRVAKGDEKIAWSHLRPGIDFMELQIQHIFELFPLPHGTPRQNVCKLLSTWGWQARPLQPGKGNFQHMSWKVGAPAPPPHPVMRGFSMDVVITLVKDLKQDAFQNTETLACQQGHISMLHIRC